MSADRKAAVAAYKERKAPAGVYAVRCEPTGERWVGGAPDLDTIGNRLWFQLRLKAFPYRSLQAAWDAHGEAAFSLDVLEHLEDEDIAYARTAELRNRARHWAETLGAPLI
ncbi:GIY-YIG nuclease family protein [Azospirillum sp.]|uniref:GIY-YIG nuclease family protein n=1 Tax=Azospirillum sp. TaxID=34012 RepID=UPI003D7181E5